MRTEVARRRIGSFERRFGEAHLYLAYHAAFPLALTPDLLYRLWANFQRDISGQVLGIPWVAVADLLLSGLCEEVGHELYEMRGETRNLLLARLQEDAKFGRQRIKELSEFLIAYVRQQLHSNDPDDRDFAEAQYWTALAYVRPSDAARELALALKKAYTSDRAELVRIASVVETFAEPLAEFEPLLVYARGMDKFARGDLDGAASQLEEIIEPGSSLEIAGITLPVPTKALSPEKITAVSEGDIASGVQIVLLKVGDGSFEKGFPVTLNILKKPRLAVEIQGWLPPDITVPECYRGWQHYYKVLAGVLRALRPAPEEPTNISDGNLAEALRNRLNAWLSSDTFRPIRDKCLVSLNPSEEIRFILQARDPLLWRLPWHLWDLLDFYPKAEVAIASVSYNFAEQLRLFRTIYALGLVSKA